jgi:hypothetical protein
MESQEWMWRIMEIRKNPSLATPDDIVKMTDDILYKIYFGKSQTGIAEVGKVLTGKLVEDIS